MYVTDAVVQQDLADIIKKGGPSNLQGWQVNLVARLHVAAYNFVVAALAKRGFLLAQIVSWDQGSDFERSIALALVLQAGGVPDGVNAEQMKALDWREQLKDADVTIAGVFQQPLGLAGVCHAGTQATGADTWLYPGDREQGNDGEETRW